MKRKSSTRFLALILAAVMVLGLASCGDSATSTSENSGGASTTDLADGSIAADSKELTKDTLAFGVSTEPTTLYSVSAPDRQTNLIVGAIYDRLVDVDDDGNIIPALATDWEVSEEGAVYTFEIRQGVKFHQGQDLDVEDVVFTLMELKSKQSSEFGLITAAEAVDDTHVKVTLEYSFSPFLYLLTTLKCGVLDKQTCEADPDAYVRNPNGTGPFKFESWQSGDCINLVRNDDYWNGPAAFSTLTFEIIADEATRLVALEAGELDAYISPSFSNKELVDQNPELTWYQTAGTQVYTMGFNNGNKPNGEKSIFADNKALRQAVCYAINKEDVALVATDGASSALYTPYGTHVAYYPEDFDGNVYNPELAKEKLAEAGYPDGLTITLKVTSPYDASAEVLQQQLAQIGIDLKIEVMERGTYVQEVYTNLDYDLTIYAVSCEYPDADGGAYRRFYSGMSGGENNWMQINDAKLDDAIMTNRTSSDPEEKAECHLKIAEIIRDESYCLPLYSSTSTLAANSNLKGASVKAGMQVYFDRWSW